MEKIAYELVLDEWIRFRQAEMREERHYQRHGVGECDECSTMSLVRARLWKRLLSY